MDTTCSPSTLFNLVAALSEAMDMVSPLVMDHHKRTAWFAVNISEELGLVGKEINEIVFAALLHDIGAFSLHERLETLQFEFENPHHHACLGYSMLNSCERLQPEARIILAHHTRWQPELAEDVGGENVPVGSHVIHLADRTAILLGNENGYINRIEDLLAVVKSNKGTVFMPEAVECLLELSGREDFWASAFKPDLEDHLHAKIDYRFLDDGPMDLTPIARVFARIIDYRSHFTATHSAGVAAVAELLAEQLGFSENNCQTMKIAGYLHDLGKIAIPTEILEKSERLDPIEYHRMQDHVIHTRKLLEKMPELGHGIRWASEHHERLNGSGYPRHSSGSEIAFGSRVVAMADIFAAVTEDRPYRKGVQRDKALDMLGRLTKEGYLDPEIFKVVEDNFDELSCIRTAAQTESLEDYRSSVECFERSQ